MDRRQFLTGFGTVAAVTCFARPVLAQAPMAALEAHLRRGALLASHYGVQPDAGIDQSAPFQRLLEHAAREDRAIVLPAGLYVVGNITLPSNTKLFGIAGQSILVDLASHAFIRAQGAKSITLDSLVFEGVSRSRPGAPRGLFDARQVRDLAISNCTFKNAQKDGIYLEQCVGVIEGNTIERAQRFGIFSVEGRDVRIQGNVLEGNRDGGIIVHRWTQGHDGSVISNNHISKTGAASGGVGQWGNAINIYRTDNVSIFDNRIDASAFSAIRANSARGVHIARNSCTQSGETAIYVEFEFEDALVESNFVETAANGIAAVNFDRGGRGANIIGNTVRNMKATGPYKPDPPGFGIGIAVEADTLVANNTIENTANFAINAGWGPYLRDVMITNNNIRRAHIGIGVSTAPGAGAATITGNQINARNGAIRAHRWAEIEHEDLSRTGANHHEQLAIANNITG